MKMILKAAAVMWLVIAVALALEMRRLGMTTPDDVKFALTLLAALPCAFVVFPLLIFSALAVASWRPWLTKNENKKHICNRMLKSILGLIAVFLLTACSAPVGGDVAPMGESPAAPMRTPKPTATGTPRTADTPTVDPYLYLHGSETAIALNQAALDQEASRLQQQQAAMGMAMTVDAATSQAWYTVTAIVKADALATSAAGTQAAGTATAYIPTQDALTKQAIQELHDQQGQTVRMWIGIVFLAIFAVIILAMFGYGAWKAIKVTEFRQSQMRPDEKGRLPAVPVDTIPGRSKSILVPDRGHRAVVGETNDDLTAEQAMMNAASQRGLEAIRAMQRLPKPSMSSLPRQGSEWSVSVDKPLPPLLTDTPLPNWGDWMERWTPGTMALGVNEGGLICANPILNPHYLLAGTTGSGKTRYGVRMLVACALASGWQVVIAGKVLDYQVFVSHPNVHWVAFGLSNGEAAKAVGMLRNVYGEIERRNHHMENSGLSLWDQTRRPHTMVVMDEFSNLADALDKGKDDLWRWARMDTAEARKYGVHMVYAVQDPTARSIDLRIRRNTTPIVFRVKDADSSRTVLSTNGAESLPERHFLTVISNLVRGMAFAPSDDEIVEFLDRHPVATAAKPDWIDADAVNVTKDEPEPESVRDLHILDLFTDGKSQADIEKAIFGYKGGSAANKVAEVLRRYGKIATTTGNMPATGAVAA